MISVVPFGCATLIALSAASATHGPTDQEKAPAIQRLAPIAKRKPTLAPRFGANPGQKKAQPSKKEAQALAKKVQRYYERIKDYSADFIQLYTRIALSRTTESRGKLFIKKPGMMRWEYEKPAKKLWIVEGKKLVVYDPEFEQVIIDPNFKTAELTTSISFLWGRGRLMESFHVNVGDPVALHLDKNAKILELVPKSGATYAKLALVVNPKTGEVVQSIIQETSGNTNHFKFKNAAINQKVSKDLFKFDPPKGTDVTYR